QRTIPLTGANLFCSLPRIIVLYTGYCGVAYITQATEGIYEVHGRLLGCIQIWLWCPC
ncbi:uncharacterized protein BDZ99DRAFT_504046, partial [Mytilinidion resinicola]